MMIVGAKGWFCAGHRLPNHSEAHGHSYEVWAYTTDGIDAEQLQRSVQSACKTLDHRMLNEIMQEPTMENIARYIQQRIPGVAKIIVTRPVEGLSCEFYPKTQ